MAVKDADIPIWDGEDVNEAVLAHHNKIRDEHATPPLVFSADHRKWARLAVADCARQDRLVHHHVGRNSGQNLFVYQPFKSGDDATFAIDVAAHGVELWYGEREHWDFTTSQAMTFGSPPSSHSAVTRNFTQMIWVATTDFGCAVARSKSGRYYVACNYFPVGNVRKQYRKNVLPIGGLLEEDEEKDQDSEGRDESASATQAVVRGGKARHGMAELRRQFRMGGELEVFDERSQDWCYASIVEFGAGLVVAEYAHPDTQEMIRRQIRLGDSDIRSIVSDQPRKQRSRPLKRSSSSHSFVSPRSNVSQRSNTSPRSNASQRSTKSAKSGMAKANKDLNRLRAEKERREAEAEEKRIFDQFHAQSRAIMQEEAGINESRLLIDAENDPARIDLQFGSSVPAHHLMQMQMDRIRAMFKEWDLDHNGTISKEELAYVFQDLGMPVEQTGILIQGIDTNGDGVVDFDEFLCWILN